MKVDINNKTQERIDEEKIIDLVAFFAKLYKLDDKELSIAIIGDEVMQGLNNEYRNIDAPTDILSFEGEADSLGELIVDYSQVKRQEAYFSKDSEQELLFIIVHGLLHLLGFDDEQETDRLVMINKGKDILKAFLGK